MNPKELVGLVEAYMDVYELDEERKEDKIIRQQGSPRTQKQKEENRNKETGLSTSTRTIRHQKSRNPYGRNSSYHHDLSMKLGLGKYNDKEGNPQYRGHYSRHPKSYDMDLKKYNRHLNRDENTPFKESYDLYDIILSHLLDEGYADTQKGAEVIMVNMSEEWREEVIETFISPFKGKVSYNNPQGLSPAMKASHKSDDLQKTEPGSKRQKDQTRKSQHLDKMYHAARTSHLP